MGLLDFVKESGAKLLDSLKSDAAGRQKSAPPEEGRLAADGDEQIQEMASDNASVTDSQTARAVQQGESALYTVKAGDTLSAIAQQFYGDANLYNKIFEANKSTLTSPDDIAPGQLLVIPLD